jgi:hypothetical protein
MQTRVMLVRAGLGNRLRFIDSTLTRIAVDKPVVLLWPVNWECRTKFGNHFFIKGAPNVKIIYLGVVSGLIFSIVNYVFSILFPPYCSRDQREFNKKIIFDSSVHSYDTSLTKFKHVHYLRPDSNCSVSEIQELDGCGDYYAFYMRGGDNKKSLATTDFKSILTALETELKKGNICVGVSDDFSLLTLLSSYGAITPTSLGATRKTERGMEIAVRDMQLLSNAKIIYASNYSSFAEVAYCLSGNATLVVAKRETLC